MPIDQGSGGFSWPQAAVIIALLVAFIALAAIDTGVAVVMGILLLLFGSDFLTDRTEEETDETDTEDEPVDAEDALDRLRARYAEGELSEKAFERRLETLLQTETIEDVESFLGDKSDKNRTHSEATRERELERSKR